MTVTKVYYKHRNMTFRVHEENKKLRENYLRQRALIRAQNIRQLEDEKNIVAARLNPLFPGVREAVSADAASGYRAAVEGREHRILKKMAPQPRDLETLTATRGMHKKLTFEDIDYILSHRKKVKLPDK